MKKYKYIGESDEMTTKGKIYNVKSNGIFIDDTNSECCLGSDYKKYFEIVESEDAKQKEKTYTEKNIDDAYDRGFKDGLNKQLGLQSNYNLQLSEIADEWTFNWQKQNIYVTSNEEIKKDEYYLGEDNNIYCLVTTVNFNGKKIILTTDQDLINYGVQAIDDEFLKWFEQFKKK